MTIGMLPRVEALECVRCAKRHPITAFARDCDACRAVAPANLTVRLAAPPAVQARGAIPTAPRSMWRWDAFLPLAAADAVSLGEGATPLVPLPDVGLGDLWIKDESQNPTWSFKDRLASAAVSAARQLDAKVIASSSSGNAGASAAAYAARAGLPCIVFTFKGAAGPMVTQMRAYGAMVLTVDDKHDRWRLLEAGVRRFGWFPTSPFFGPVVGSNPFGVEGYKTIAYEIAESLDWRAPDWCAIPVCYGDALYGIWKGFEELRALGWIDRTPRMLAAEVSGSLADALASGAAMPPDVPMPRPSIATSIGASQGSVQSIEAIKRSGGRALRVSDEAILDWQARLAKRAIWMEPSAAAAYPAIEQLRADGTIAPNARVVALLTASGLKDVAATDAALAPAPLVPGNLDAALDALRTHYRFSTDD